MQPNRTYRLTGPRVTASTEEQLEAFQVARSRCAQQSKRPSVFRARMEEHRKVSAEGFRKHMWLSEQQALLQRRREAERDLLDVMERAGIVEEKVNSEWAHPDTHEMAGEHLVPCASYPRDCEPSFSVKLPRGVAGSHMPLRRAPLAAIAARHLSIGRRMVSKVMSTSKESPSQNSCLTAWVEQARGLMSQLAEEVDGYCCSNAAQFTLQVPFTKSKEASSVALREDNTTSAADTRSSYNSHFSTESVEGCGDRCFLGSGSQCGPRPKSSLKPTTATYQDSQCAESYCDDLVAWATEQLHGVASQFPAASAELLQMHLDVLEVQVRKLRRACQAHPAAFADDRRREQMVDNIRLSASLGSAATHPGFSSVSMCASLAVKKSAGSHLRARRDLYERYQHRHPGTSWLDAVSIVTNGESLASSRRKRAAAIAVFKRDVNSVAAALESALRSERDDQIEEAARRAEHTQEVKARDLRRSQLEQLRKQQQDRAQVLKEELAEQEAQKRAAEDIRRKQLQAEFEKRLRELIAHREMQQRLKEEQIAQEACRRAEEAEASMQRAEYNAVRVAARQAEYEAKRRSLAERMRVLESERAEKERLFRDFFVAMRDKIGVSRDPERVQQPTAASSTRDTVLTLGEAVAGVHQVNGFTSNEVMSDLRSRLLEAFSHEGLQHSEYARQVLSGSSFVAPANRPSVDNPLCHRS